MNGKCFIIFLREISKEVVKKLIQNNSTNAIEIANFILKEKKIIALSKIQSLLKNGEPALRLITTLTGQSLIKFTKKIGNHFYNKELEDDKDYCIYIDTDSVFYSAVPLLDKRFPDEKLSDVMKTQKISEIATEVQGYMNTSYDYFAKKFCNIDKHRFEIKQEIIARAGFFVVKKRYGMRIINDNGVKVNKVHVKGLDTVRSTFPPAMKHLLKSVLDDILNYVPKDKVDERILDFKSKITQLSVDDIANPVGVKNIEKYTPKKDDGLFSITLTD